MKYIYLSWKVIKSILITGVLFIVCYSFFVLLFKFSFVHGLYATIESFVYSQIFISTARPSEHLIIIDEEDKIYNRATYAQLISGLNRSGAKIIAMDVLFDEEKNPVEDSVLVAATQSASDKLIHAIEFLSIENHAIIPDRFNFSTSYRPSPYKFIEGVCGATLPFDDLLEETTYLGHVCAISDIARRDEKYFPLIIYYNDRLYPSLPLLAVMKFLNCRVDSVLNFRDDIIELKGDSKLLQIPIDNRAQTLINFISPSKFSGKILSVKEALKLVDNNNKLFRDKIILVGNSRDSQEQTYGPHFKRYPNLIIFGSLISQITNNENIREGILESLFASFALVTLCIIGWIFFSDKIKSIKYWYVFICAFLILLIFAAISLKLRTKTYVILPWLVFCISYTLSKKFITPVKKLFISYSHRDIDFVIKLKTGLEARGIAISIDIETLKFGDKIKDFIEKSVKEADFIISIVSKNSLKSPWVIVESLETLNREKIEKKKKFMPVFIDRSFLDEKFQVKLYKKIEKSINKLVSEINKLSKKHIPTTNLDNKKYMLVELRNNLDKVLTKLYETSVADFSSEEKFKENLPRLAKQIIRIQ